jgi:hypothetical protein
MPRNPEPRFACDAIRCGLARGLRVAGYYSTGREGIADQELIRLCPEGGWILLP